MIAAGAMALSSLSVVSNANRLRGFRASPPTGTITFPASEPRVEIGSTESTKEMDPVCGMEVDPVSAPATADLNGRTYYFCSAGCRDHFLAAERVRGQT
jgi:Cu+-exporting ATPase